MHASAVLASLAGLVGLAVASHGRGRPDAALAVPDEWVHHPHHLNNTHSQEKRGALGMYECKNKNWYGPCTWTKADGGQCHNWLYGPTGSMGPDKGLTCTVYSAYNCPTAANQHHLDYFQAPGVPDYEANAWLGKGDIGNGPASYKCKKLVGDAARRDIA